MVDSITKVSVVTGCKHTQKDKKDRTLSEAMFSSLEAAVLITQHSFLLVSNEPTEGQSADTDTYTHAQTHTHTHRHTLNRCSVNRSTSLCSNNKNLLIYDQYRNLSCTHGQVRLR